MYHYDAKIALEELQEDAVLPHPVKLRDMILRTSHAPVEAQELNREFQDYLTRFGELQLAGLDVVLDCANGATYRVAPELTAIEFPERRYEQLIGLVVDALPERGRRKRLHEIGVAFGRELAREARLRPAKGFRTALGRVCAALGGLGYQASVAEMTDERAVITTATCPLRPLVRARPRLAELDRGMWAALLVRAFAGSAVDDIACDTPNCQRDDADCRVLLTLRARPGQPQAGA